MHPRKLTRREEFVRVMRRGLSQANHLLVLRAAPNQLDVTRFGYSVSKQVGNAVVRNLVRRRLREAVRQLPVRQGWDVVISARTASASADFHALQRSVEQLSRRSNLLVPGDQEGKA